MKLSRDVTVKMHLLLDQLLPPVIRDSMVFMYLPFRLLFRDKYRIFRDFKNRSHEMSAEEYRQVYADVLSVNIERPTDLNSQCIEAVLQNLTGKSVLEVGCGKCLLSDQMSKTHKVTALDMIIDKELRKRYPRLKFVEARIEKLPFRDNKFDTVVCTHTLEHIQDLAQGISELRRVAKKRLIIVVPKQRPYKYTFDLHLHFFPYEHSLLTVMGPGRNNSCRTVGGDLFYIEDFT